MFLRMHMRSSGSHFMQSWQLRLHTPFRPSISVGLLSHSPAATRRLKGSRAAEETGMQAAGSERRYTTVVMNCKTVHAVSAS
jgi:hypothetical protein